ncbi:MAG TPA: dihydrolipoyl dehydrogenase, partial [Candidatus Methanoperedenaceae archaeon]|nr:dihydrolipoyl dehydrogenase [Candidatus Methanoperedenaceae archaeon]
YHETAEFVEPYVLRVGDVHITSRMIFLCTGSRPALPPVEGLTGTGYLTSDTVLTMERLPRSIVIIGGGYIAAEFGHFFASMGSEVTVIGRNRRFIPDEEPEISDVAKLLMSEHMKILTNYEALEVLRDGNGLKKVIARERESKQEIVLSAEEILVATGRVSNTDILHPEKGGIRTDKNGWIEVNEFMETSQPGIYAFGDADGKFLFKHVANYESRIVYYNAALNWKVRADYHAIPHAIFSYPEVAGVGMKEAEAIGKLGENKVLIGFQRYEDTARGLSMGARGCFVKVLVERGTGRILGAHIIGPHASILLHEIIPLMYTQEQDARVILQGMHIHPALSEVVERAFAAVMEPAHYHHVLGHFFEELGLPIS